MGIMFFVGLVVEMIFVWIIVKFLEISFLYVFLGLQILKLITWIFYSFLEHILFHLLWRKDMVNMVFKSLSSPSFNYPNPTKYSEYILSENYFRNVMNDEDNDISTRLDSSQVYFLLTGNFWTGGFIKHLRLNNVFTDGLYRYHNEIFHGSIYQNTYESE